MRFCGLLFGLPALAGLDAGHTVKLFDAFYRSGALVFGGGHVVLPLLQQQIVCDRMVTRNDFLAGYGAAQTVPGPLFTFAAFLGWFAPEAPSHWSGARRSRLRASSCPGCCSCLRRCPIGRQCVPARRWRQHFRASMPRLLDCWQQHSIRQSGLAGFALGPTSQSPLLDSCS